MAQTLEAAAAESGGTEAEDANDEEGKSRLVRDKKIRGRYLRLTAKGLGSRVWLCTQGRSFTARATFSAGALGVRYQG